MDIVFIGSGRFGLPSLEALKEAGHSILCVVTQPDRKKGRGMHLAETAIKLYAKKSGIKAYDPQEINAKESANYLKMLNADLFVVISYGQILKEEILSIPRIFSLNVHASFLPKYRGAAPINWAITNGEAKTGITIIKMSPQMDAGPVLLQESFSIEPRDDALTLEAKLGRLSALLLPQAIQLIANNSYTLKEQDNSCASYAPKLKKEQGLIVWNRPAQEIYNLIRGFVEWPGAFIRYQRKLIKVHKASVSPEVSPSDSLITPGQIISVSQQGILVAAAKGYLLIEELQPEGKRRMAAKEFISGHRVKPGESL